MAVGADDRPDDRRPGHDGDRHPTTDPADGHEVEPTAVISPDPPTERAWMQASADLAAALATDTRRGLTAAEAADRLARHGRNELRTRARTPAWRLFAGQFANAMILVLLAAAAVTVVIGDLKDTAVILAIVLLNGIIGFAQEYRAAEALEALRRMTSPTARVIRDGTVATIPAAELVPGDLLRLEAGDVVTADSRLVEVAALRINEAALTGESEPAEKLADPLPDVPPGQLADQRNMAFSGTAVTYGRATALVVATGMATAFGRIADLLAESRGGSTPLQRRLDQLGRWLAAGALGICVLIFVAGIARGEAIEEMLLTAISLAVAAIPEGLPAVVTIGLALGARRMAQRRALVRKLPAVETLGSVTVICSDKTGTLTQNRMLVERVWTPAAEYAVGGVGYEPSGSFAPEPVGDADLDGLLRVAAACNDAVLHAPPRPDKPWSITGDPTEGALLALAAKRGIWHRDLSDDRPRVDEIAFDAARRRMATLHDDAGVIWIAVKGALESIVPLLVEGERREAALAEETATRWAADGYRVLALAERRLPELPRPTPAGESDLHLLGLVGMTDPPRPESAPAIEACRSSGVRPVMITGDHPLTARAIARRIGLLRPGDGVVTGAELEGLPEAELDRLVPTTAVYARTNPEHKVAIVEAWRRAGAVVAMTGDGVNDAPALTLADIGVAMGLTGTEVSKEAADMVLADDDFATIVGAIEEGRRIYDNIRRVVRYLLTTNSAEIWVMFLAPILGLPLPLLAVQILWVNLVTDGLPALALGVEPAEPDVMRRPPRPANEPVLGRGLWQSALRIGLVMAAITLAVQWLALDRGWPWQTMVFSTLALLQLGNALAVRSERAFAFRLGFGSNLPLTAALAGTLVTQLALVYVPALQPLFATEVLGPLELGVVLVASTGGLLVTELEKWWFARREGGAQAGRVAPPA
jgi:Ca2+-transporting ATPase